MHVIHAKDGYRCLLDTEAQEVELLHNDKCLIGGSVFLPEVLDVIASHGLMEKLAIHTCMFKGWLHAYAKWLTWNVESIGLLPDQVIAFPLGEGKRLEAKLDEASGDIGFTVITPHIEDNTWEVKPVFRCKLEHLKKIVAFFS